VRQFDIASNFVKFCIVDGVVILVTPLNVKRLVFGIQFVSIVTMAKDSSKMMSKDTFPQVFSMSMLSFVSSVAFSSMHVNKDVFMLSIIA